MLILDYYVNSLSAMIGNVILGMLMEAMRRNTVVTNG
jgi:hypothetical protein